MRQTLGLVGKGIFPFTIGRVSQIAIVIMRVIEAPSWESLVARRSSTSDRSQRFMYLARRLTRRRSIQSGNHVSNILLNISVPYDDGSQK